MPDDQAVVDHFTSITGELPGYKGAPPLFTEGELDEIVNRLFPEDKRGTRESGHWGHRGRPGQRGGSLPGGAYLRLNKYARRDTLQGVREVQAHTAETGKEALVGIGFIGGKVNGTQYGSEHSVHCPDRITSASDIIIHSHPSNGGPSAGDVRIFLGNKHQTHEVVVSADGVMWMLSKKPDTPREEYHSLFRFEVDRAYEAGREEHREAHWERNREPDADKGRSLQIYHDGIISVVSKRLGLDYRRLEPPGGVEDA